MDVKPPKKRRINNASARPNVDVISTRTPKTVIRQTNQVLREKSTKARELIKPEVNFSDIRQSLIARRPNVWQLVKDNKLLIFYTAIIFLAAFFLYLYKLRSWPKPTQLESVESLSVQSFTDLSSNVVFGPQKFLDYLLLKLALASPLGLRLASVIFTVLAVIMLYFIIKRWLNAKIAILATLIFATSTLIIVQTRDAGFINSFFLVVPLLLLTGLFIKRNPSSVWIFPIVFSVALLAYIPGFIWFLLFTMALYFNNFYILIQESSHKRIIGILSAFIIPIIPLIYFLISHGRSLKVWLGLPADFTFHISNIISNITSLPNTLFVSGLSEPTLWLHGSPVIDVATGILMLTGLVFTAKDKLHPVRFVTLIGMLLITLSLIAVGGSVYISLLMPIIYIYAAFGIYYFLEQWLSIFPRNPFARSVGYVLMSILVLSTVFYHTSRYFVVWPRNSNVTEAFDSVSSDTINTRSNNKFYFR